jgi:hypothetical protein
MGFHPDPPVLARLPQFDERRRQERQSSGLVGHLLDQGVGKGRLPPQSGSSSRELDRPRQLLARERPDQDVVGGQGLREIRIRGAMPVVIGADREDHGNVLWPPLRRAGKRLYKVGALRLAGAQGEGLLELIDHEDQTSLRRERLHGCLDRVLGPARERRS